LYKHREENEREECERRRIGAKEETRAYEKRKEKKGGGKKNNKYAKDTFMSYQQ
jgi:hypothetical protein